MHAVVKGKRPLPTSDAERHHYVAQFQLTKFRGKGRLYQLDKEDGSCEVVTPKKAVAVRSRWRPCKGPTGL
jgi:hypothetical protein